MTTLATAVSVALLGLSAATPATKPGSPSHHCVKDGAELTGVSKKECKKQSGKWEKIGLTPTATPAKDAAAPTPPAADTKAP